MRVVAIFTEALCNQCLTRRSEPPVVPLRLSIAASFDLEQIQVEQKAPNDYVTEVDKAAEEAIIDVLLSAYPTHAVLAEESGGSNNLNDESENVLDHRPAGWHDQFHAPVSGILYFDCPATEGSHDASRYLRSGS